MSLGAGETLLDDEEEEEADAAVLARLDGGWLGGGDEAPRLDEVPVGLYGATMSTTSSSPSSMVLGLPMLNSSSAEEAGGGGDSGVTLIVDAPSVAGAEEAPSFTAGAEETCSLPLLVLLSVMLLLLRAPCLLQLGKLQG